MLVRSELVLVDDLATIGDPPSAYIVSSTVVDFGDFLDRFEGHLDLTWFINLTVSQEDNEGLHLEVDVLEEGRPLDLSRLLLLLLKVLLISELFQVL
jgi:hypothetical protein